MERMPNSVARQGSATAGPISRVGSGKLSREEIKAKSADRKTVSATSTRTKHADPPRSKFASLRKQAFMAITPEPSAESKQDEGKKPITVARRGVAPSPTVSKPPSATRSKSAKKMTADTKNKTDEVVFTNIESSKRDKAKFVELSAHDVLSKTNETDYIDVYEIILRGERLGRIPNLEKFQRVRVVDLSSNHIATIGCLECCRELRDLKLYDNELAVIEKLDALSELTNLQLQYNQIRSLGRGLINLTKLNMLRLDWNQLREIQGKEVAALSKLTQLDISNNQLEDLSALNSLSNLQELFAANNRIKTLDLSRCRKLTEVDVSGNRIVDLNNFARHASTLQILNVSQNAISKIEFTHPLVLILNKLIICSALEELYLTGNSIKKISTVPKLLPNIQILNLSHNKLICLDLNVLKKCSSLRELSLHDNPLEEYTHTTVSTALPDLQVLDGMVVHKSAHSQHIPLMRPMSATNVISSRHVQSQIDSLTETMATFRREIESKFDSIRMSVDALPVSSTPRSTRPSSRAGRRSRIMEAQLFASNHFS